MLIPTEDILKIQACAHAQTRLDFVAVLESSVHQRLSNISIHDTQLPVIWE